MAEYSRIHHTRLIKKRAVNCPDEPRWSSSPRVLVVTQYFDWEHSRPAFADNGLHYGNSGLGPLHLPPSTLKDRHRIRWWPLVPRSFDIVYRVAHGRTASGSASPSTITWFCSSEMPAEYIPHVIFFSDRAGLWPTREAVKCSGNCFIGADVGQLCANFPVQVTTFPGREIAGK